LYWLCYPSSTFLCSVFKVGRDQIGEVTQIRYLGLLLGLTVLDCQRKSNIQTKTLNSMALVRERTIPTGRPPPVGEVSANFCG
jgi:hypothetical protein